MRFKIRCNTCGEESWHRGWEEKDVGAVGIHGNDLSNGCEHIQDGGEYTIIDSEIDSGDYDEGNYDEH